MPINWKENEHAICLSVTSDGTSGPDWVERLKKKFRKVDPEIRKVLRSGDFTSTNGTTYNITILKGNYWLNGYLTIQAVRNLIENKVLKEPNLEAACLVLEKFHGLKLPHMMVMHKPVETAYHLPTFFEAQRISFHVKVGMSYNNLNDSLDNQTEFVLLSDKE